MIGTKIIKRRIKATKNIAKVTKAMQMVAATKMGRAQKAALMSRPYALHLSEVARHLSQNRTEAIHPFLINRSPETVKELTVVVAPEKGLCGSLASGLEPLLSRHHGSFISVGAKARGLILKNKRELLADFPLGLRLPGFDLVPPLAHLITEGFIKGEYGQVNIVYSHFVNTLKQNAAEKVLLPIIMGAETTEKVIFRDYIFEPDPQSLLDSLLKHYIEIEIFQVLLEGFASEQSARMISMKNATDNAGAVIEELTMFYNKSRQQEITSEIADIVKGSYEN